MDKAILIIITLIFLIVALFFREETGIRTTSIVVLSIMIIVGFIKIFFKKE